jgi:hypothetical protein
MRVAAEGLTRSSCGCIPGARCSIGSRGEDLGSVIDDDKARREHPSYLTLKRPDGVMCQVSIGAERVETGTL